VCAKPESANAGIANKKWLRKLKGFSEVFMFASMGVIIVINKIQRNPQVGILEESSDA
jgi:hypothetical protein